MRNTRHRALTISLYFASQLTVRAQTPPTVAGFPLIPVRHEALSIPAGLRPFVPRGQFLRDAFHTDLSPSGETIFLFDDGAEVLPRAYLGALHHGRSYGLLDGGIVVESFLLLRMEKGKNGLAVAYHTGEDSADTEFAIFVASENSYKRVFFEQTMEGEMQIVSKDPLKCKIWSAAPELGPQDSDWTCVWCFHRFRTKTYAWDGNSFKLVSQGATKRFFRPPEPIASNAFVEKPLTATAKEY